MKSVLVALSIVLVLSGSAWAQGGKGGLPVGPNPDAKRNAEDAKVREQSAKDYDELMRRLRAQPAAPKADPWAHMRPAEK